MGLGERRAMISPMHPQLSVVRQCALVGLNRSGVYHRRQGDSAATLVLMRHLRRLGHRIGRHRVRRLMGQMGLIPIYQRPRTSLSHPQHKVYPSLLRNLLITRPNLVRCANITYIPMRRGFLYLAAVMDGATRRVLASRLSNTMETDFYIEALTEALAKFGQPEIVNTDQGSRFTSPRFTALLANAGVRISMNGRLPGCGVL